MRRLIRLFLFNAVAFTLVIYFIPSASYSNNLEVLGKSAVVYSVLAMFLKPVLSLLALPINFFTFGLFSWLINVILLFLVTRIEPGLKIVAYTFPGYFYQGFVIPRFEFGTFGTAVLISFLVSFIASFLIWISD